MSNHPNPPPRPPRPPRPQNTDRPGQPSPPRPQRMDRPGGPPPQDYGQPLSPAPTQKSNSLALISLISGVLGVLTIGLSLCMWCLGGIPLLLGVAAAVTGYLGKKQIDESGGPQSSRTMASAGMILGIATIVLTIVSVAIGMVWSGFRVLGDFI